MNAILTMSSFIFPLITFPYVSRILLPEGTGKVSFAASIVNYFLLLAQLGIPTYGIRTCAKIREDKDKLNKTIQEIFKISFIMCIFSYTIFLILLYCVPRLWQEKELMLVTSTSILFTTIGVEWVFKALEMYSYITWRSVAFKCIALAAMFLLIHGQEDYIIYGAVSIFASSASNILNFVYLHQLVDLKNHYKLELSNHIKPIFIFLCIQKLVKNILKVRFALVISMLGFMKTDMDVGYYNAAVKIKTILVSIVSSLGAVLLPRVTVYIENNDQQKFRNISVKAMQFVLLVAIPMMVYFILFAKPCVLLLSGTEYENAILPMQLMMPTLLCIGLTNIMGMQIMVPLGREIKVLVSVVIGAVVDLLLNIVLISRYSVAGAAIGTMVAEIAVLIYQYLSDNKLFYSLFCQLHIWKIVLSTIFASCVSSQFIKWEKNNITILIVSSICFVAVYLGSLIFLRETSIMELANMMKKKRY